MLFPPLVHGRLVKRYKRFLADFELHDGSLVTAHCANPGSMKSIVEHGPTGYLSAARPGRKLGYTWELACLPPHDANDSPTYVYVNPTGANRLVAEAIERRLIPQLAGYDLILPEVKYGDGSRIDFLLRGAPGKAYVEVKNVTLSLGDRRGAFPDSVTARGTKHLRELMRVAREGHTAMLVFCVGRTDVDTVEAARDIDPVYAATMDEAILAGVDVVAYGGDITERAFELTRPIEVLSPSRSASS